ncbi:MAG: SH3 domain-containing protein [Anaerolineae bacterium]|nr:SH3 domain-containing protein [Anaerolineae bacterium]
MRRLVGWIGGIGLALGMIGLAGCSLSRDEQAVVSATPPAPTMRLPDSATPTPVVISSPTVTSSADVIREIAPTTTLAPTESLPAAATATLPTDTPVLAPVVTTAPTLTPAGPPTLAPLDDGSGRTVPGTGGRTRAGDVVEEGGLYAVGDVVRVQTTGGDTLNLRAEPGGEVLTRLADGTPVTILDGPRDVDGYRWWQVRTGDGLVGWAVESITQANGSRLWTLVPAE